MTFVPRSPARCAAGRLAALACAWLCACSTQAPPPGSAARSLINLGCQVVGNPCPTNFMPVGGLKAPAQSVAAGGNGVWALDATGAVYRFDPGAQAFAPVAGSLAWLSVGGGNLVAPDEVWGGTDDRHLFRWGSGWQEVASPAGDPIASVAAGPGHNLDNCHLTEVWGVSVNGHAFRRNTCNQTWEAVGAPPLGSISAGGGEVWALDAQGSVYRFDPGGGGFQQVPGTLSQLAAGVDGVWGVLARTPVNTQGGALARIAPGNPFTPQVFQYDPATRTLVQIPNAAMVEIDAGGAGVWALDGGRSVWRLQAVARKFVAMRNIRLRSLSVGSGTGVWGIDESNAIRAFVTPSVLVGSGHANR